MKTTLEHQLESLYTQLGLATEEKERNELLDRIDEIDNKLDSLEEEFKNTEECPDCFGEMIWCESCEMYSQVCCEEYGSCACS